MNVVMLFSPRLIIGYILLNILYIILYSHGNSVVLYYLSPSK